MILFKIRDVSYGTTLNLTLVHLKLLEKLPEQGSDEICLWGRHRGRDSPKRRRVCKIQMLFNF